MQKVLNFLHGKKTYLASAGGAVVVVLWFFNVLDEKVAMTLLGLLGFGGLSALRSGVAKATPEAE